MLGDAKGDGAENAPGPLLVYLIHGTWGRGVFPGKTLLGRPRTAPTWCEPSGAFYEDFRAALLARGLRPQMKQIQWSGRNSVVERHHVARDLAKLLDDQVTADPSCHQLLVGHSHGGNIAVDSVRFYRQSTTDIGVVTLATPFVDLWTAMPVRDESGYTQAYGRASYFRVNLTQTRRTLSCLTATVVLAWAGVRFGVLAPFSETSAKNWAFGGVIAATGLKMVLSFALGWTGAGDDELMRLPRIEAPRMPGASRCRTLVLRGTDDEAALTLAGGSLQAILGSAASRFSLILLSLLSPFALAFTQLPGDWPTRALVLLCFAIAVFLAGSLLEAIGRAAAGREFLLMGGLLNVSINSAPDTDGGENVKTLAGSPAKGWAEKRYRFKHGLYAHRDCVPAIINWLAERPEQKQHAARARRDDRT